MNSLSLCIETLDGIIASVERSISVGTSDSDVPTAAITPSDGGKTPGAIAKGSPRVAASPDVAADFHMCDLRVGQVEKVSCHPEADGLFHMIVAIGKHESRSVCAGLRKFMSSEQLQGRKVVLICNLKPRKLRGVESEAMCLAGSAQNSQNEKEVVVPLTVPANTPIGSFIHAQGLGGERAVVPGKKLSGKVWDRVVSLLSVVDGNASYSGCPMRAEGSMVTCPGLPNGSDIR